MNVFGSNWTQQKVTIVELYAKAYLEIMKLRPYWKLMYFDGFAGSGEVEIEHRSVNTVIEGAAKKIVSITEPRSFDMYYFVELDMLKAEKLRLALNVENRNDVFVVSNDCNEKLASLAQFLKSPQGRSYKVLAFIDPFGMNLNFSSLQGLVGLDIDLWLLIPTGIGANRLLTKDGVIPEAWLQRLESFFGIDRDLVLNNFYYEQTNTDLFGNATTGRKKKLNGTSRIRDLYITRLNEVFQFVSDSFQMRNSVKSLMYDFVLASNNKTAAKIANDIVKRANSGPYGTK